MCEEHLSKYCCLCASGTLVFCLVLALQRKLLLQDLAPTALDTKFGAAKQLSEEYVARWCSAGKIAAWAEVSLHAGSSVERDCSSVLLYVTQMRAYLQ